MFRQTIFSQKGFRSYYEPFYFISRCGINKQVQPAEGDQGFIVGEAGRV